MFENIFYRKYVNIRKDIIFFLKVNYTNSMDVENNIYADLRRGEKLYPS